LEVTTVVGRLGIIRTKRIVAVLRANRSQPKKRNRSGIGKGIGGVGLIENMKEGTDVPVKEIIRIDTT